MLFMLLISAMHSGYLLYEIGSNITKVIFHLD